MIAQLAMAMRGGVKRARRRIVDALLPPACPLTGAPLDRAGGLSADVWRNIQFIDDPCCTGCGAPFAVEYGESALCPACIADPPAFDNARAALVYDDASRALIIGFKHYDRTERARLFGKWLAQAGRRLAAGATPLVTPIPLHWRKRVYRMYNQAALIGEYAAQELNAPYESDLLLRVRATKQQHSLPSGRARRANVAGAFVARRSRLGRIRGSHILLVDDVLTTGATLSAAARTLKKAGAARVDALVLARVVKGGVGAI